jgi:hypothetical protein
LSKARLFLLSVLLSWCSVQAEEKVLFSFDDHWLPFQYGVQLSLVSSQSSSGTASNQVIAMGPPGAPDSRGVIYYGTVCEVNGELWMWYLGMGDQDEERRYRIHFAKSKDGRKWEKPALGLVKYGANSDNNLVDLDQGRFSVAGCIVYHEPEEPDANRRFKMVFTGSKYPGLLFGVAYSPDGVRWTESPQNPRGANKMEPQGGIKYKGAYLLNGQFGGAPSSPVRTLVTQVSYDFEHWTEASVQGFRRDPIAPRPINRTGARDGEQVHLGAGLWDRGNVVLGFYGQWHGHPNNDRRWVSIDTGFVVSHDALHFYEPIPDFRIIESKETPDWWLPDGTTRALDRAPAIMQGQGFANVGEETLFWYSIWVVPHAGVRVARWERDRLGYLQSSKKNAHVVSAPLSTSGNPTTVSLNVSGLGEYSSVKVTVLDEQFRPLPGYEAAQCTGPAKSGLRESVTWGDKKNIITDKLIRLRIDFAGVRPEDIRLYAAYVTSEE